MRLLRIILIVMFGLCLTVKAQSAEAHSLAPAYSASSHVASSAPAGEIRVATVSNPQNEDGCKDGCCTGTMSCCVAALPATVDMPFHQESSSIVALSYAPLPQGTPFTLLRPPRFTA